MERRKMGGSGNGSLKGDRGVGGGKGGEKRGGLCI